MIKKITDVEVAKEFGYKSGSMSFAAWKKDGNKNKRYQWLRIGAIFIKNGMSEFTALDMLDRIKRLEAEKKVLEDELNEVCSKLEGLIK